MRDRGQLMKSQTKHHCKTTILDVARIAGVGKMTVSRVLNGTARVSEANAAKVRKAVKILGYQPNEVARSLRQIDSRTIGVIFPYLYDPYYATCSHAISNVARSHGYSVFLTTCDQNPEIERMEANLLIGRQISGLLTVPTAGNERFFAKEVLSRIPVVTLGRPVLNSRLDSVFVANRVGARSAVEHLIEHGYRKVGFFGFSAKIYSMRERYAGYCEALLNANLSPGIHVDCVSQARTVELVRCMRNNRKLPRAIFAANNMTMRFLLHALAEVRIEIPHEVALVGFDDFEMADLYRPAITVIRQPVYQLGETSANILFERILDSDERRTSRRVVLPLELIVRNSCGC